MKVDEMKIGIDIIREALPYPPDEHHSRCNSLYGEMCDCYARVSNDAHVELDRLADALDRETDAAGAARTALKVARKVEARAAVYKQALRREFDRAKSDYDAKGLAYDEGRMDLAGELLDALAAAEETK